MVTMPSCVQPKSKRIENVSNRPHVISSELIIRSCPLCAQDNRGREPLPYSRATWKIVKCSACRFVYLQNVLPYAELMQAHAWTQLHVAEREDRRQREPVFQFFSQGFKAFRLQYLCRNKAPRFVHRYVGRGRVLDVGCGEGLVIQRLAPQLTPYGIEIDVQAAGIAHQYAAERGGRVYQRDALSGLQSLEDEFFDGLLMRSYLEHENEPLPVLRHAFRVLRPGGRIIVKAPNFASWNRHLRGRRWCGFRFPDHVNYFTPRTLVAMVRQAKLELVRFGRLDRQPTSDNMWLIAEKPRRDASPRAV